MRPNQLQFRRSHGMQYAKIRRITDLITVLAIGLSLSAFGCQKENTEQAKLPPPEVTVANPVVGQIQDDERFTGRVEPLKQVEVRAKVSGYLSKIFFEPGQEIEENKPLCDIDPKPFQADVDRAQADLGITEAQAQRLESAYQRAVTLRGRGAISQEEFEKAVGDRSEANAAVKSAKAKLNSSKLNLDYSHIVAPFSGRLGDRLIDEGNLVTLGPDSKSLLTTILSVDPMTVAFDMDDNTLQRLIRDIQNNRIKLERDKDGKFTLIPVEIGQSQDGSEYPIKDGKITFINNRVDPKTGTIRIKAQCSNPKSATGVRNLVPGAFARVRILLGDKRKAMMVPESALGSDQGNRFLYVVNEKKEGIRLNAKVGVLQNGLREIENVQGAGDEKPRALKADEEVIVNGLQRVRPGLTVDPKTLKTN